MANGRCRMHGGKSTGPKDQKGNKNGVRHGIYASGLRADEVDLWHDVPVGSLDDEIRLAKLQLRRAKLAQAAVDNVKRGKDGVESSRNPIGMELSEIKAESGTKEAPGSLTVTRKRPDYETIINRLLGRIGELELRRVTIVTELGGGGGENPREKARQIKEALDEIADSVAAPDGQKADDHK